MILNLFLSIITFVNAIILISTVFYIFLIYIDKSFILLSSSILLHWFCNELKSVKQTCTLFWNYLFLLFLVNYLIIVTLFKTATFFYNLVYLIFLITSFISLIFFIFFTSFTFFILFILLTIFIWYFFILKTEKCNIITLMHLKGSNLRCQV